MSIYGAMFAGVSGLAAQSNALSMISDNIANVNTVGYKGVSARFSTLVTQAATQTTHTPGGVTSAPYSYIDRQGLLQGSASGTDLAGYDAQLASTAMFYKPAEGVAFTKDPALITTMDFVRKFLFDKGILGEGAPSPEFVGVSFPDGSVYGDEANVKLRFDTTYMQMAADGAL